MDNPPGWKLIHTLRAHSEPIRGPLWSTDGSRLATPGSDGLLVVWDAKNGKPERVIRHEAPVLSAAFSPEGDNIAASVVESPSTSGVSSSYGWSPYGDGPPLSSELDELLGDYNVSTEWVPELRSAEGLGVAVRVSDAASGENLASFVSDEINHVPDGIAWAANGRHLYTASQDGLGVWQVRTGTLVRCLPGSISALALSPKDDGIIGIEGNEWIIWDADYDEASFGSNDEEESYTAVAWSSQDGVIALGVQNGIIEIIRPSDPSRVRYLEGHTRAITSVSFSHDGRLLATKSLDGTVRLWDCDTWDAVSLLHEPARGQSTAAGVAFAPTSNILATLGPAGKVVRLWELDVPAIMARRSIAPTVHYSNAKVVLLGDATVGKTGLGLVLSGHEFQATESTHQRNVWLLDAKEHADVPPERRETYLWDLAGQPGYRLLHQLHLNDVAAAMIVFDAHSGSDPFAAVRYWVRALRQADRTVPKLLVAGRIDRGGPQVSDERRGREMSELGIDSYLETSAKEGVNIEKLLGWIVNTIDWDRIPKVSSTGLFDSIKSFLLAKRDQGTLLTRGEDLLQSYAAIQDEDSTDHTSSQFREEFETCIGRLAARGLIRRLSFGGLVLLRPEVLDAYASALVNAARDEPDGTGSISEDRARTGDFAIPSDERLKDSELEKLVLTATVEEVLRHEVALREQSEDGPFLVFPTQSRREVPPLVEPDSTWQTITFEGPVPHVYATLVVRLSHSGLFVRDETFHNAASFRGRDGMVLGVTVTERREAEGMIQLFSRGLVDQTLRGLFADYVVAHLRRRALPDTVEVDRTPRCGGCGFEATDQLCHLAQERGRDHVTCPVCDRTIDIAVSIEEDSANELVVQQMDTSADKRRDLVAAKTVLAGKEQVGQFDVLLAYPSEDKSAVERIAQNLRDNAVHPWVDTEQVPPGRWFQDEIQKAIGDVRSAAIIIGKGGLGRWEIAELRGVMQECIDRDISVIPVILPGAKVPEELRFLRQLRWVAFEKSVDEETGMQELVWGIERGRRTSPAQEQTDLSV